MRKVWDNRYKSEDKMTADGSEKPWDRGIFWKILKGDIISGIKCQDIIDKKCCWEYRTFYNDVENCLIVVTNIYVMSCKISSPIKILSTYIALILPTHKNPLQLEWRKALRPYGLVLNCLSTQNICFYKLNNCLSNTISLTYRSVTPRNTMIHLNMY